MAPHVPDYFHFTYYTISSYLIFQDTHPKKVTKITIEGEEGGENVILGAFIQKKKKKGHEVPNFASSSA